jgi:hypothetical protein
MPVRIAAQAFGRNRPERDLTLSPAHAVCLDLMGEIFVPVSSLINGATVAQLDLERVTYWHVELDSHDVLIANGLPAESYLDVGNRMFFATGEGRIDPDRTLAAGVSDACRPFHHDGALVTAARSQIKARALALGETPLAGAHLLVDDVRADAEIAGFSVVFAFPSSAKDVWLVSEVGVPAHVGLEAGGDDRRLGLCLGSITVDDGLRGRRHVAAGDSRLREGFHDAEGGHRWTAGRARLPAALWENCRGAVTLRLSLCAAAVPRWIAPARTAREPADLRFARRRPEAAEGVGSPL